MNTLHPIVAGIMGLGAPELVVVLAILALLTAPMVLIVWLILRRKTKDDSNSVSLATHKRCPDCAEFVLIEARVCKHCGCRFGSEDAKRAKPL